RNEAERALCAIWARVLGVPRVGIEDNYFRLGGDSILSIRVLADARAAGIHVQLADLFRHQTIAQLVQAAETAAPVHRAIGAFELLSPTERMALEGRDDIEDAYPLSQLQQGMVFHSELDR